jgi:hypothetical protein
MTFKPNYQFQRKYDKIFQWSPEAANLFLLVCELADKNGQVKTTEEELAKLLAERFEDPQEYAL